jgi:hypothetical protein
MVLNIPAHWAVAKEARGKFCRNPISGKDFETNRKPIESHLKQKQI